MALCPTESTGSSLVSGMVGGCALLLYRGYREGQQRIGYVLLVKRSAIGGFLRTADGRCRRRPVIATRPLRGAGKVVMRNERNRTCPIAMFPHYMRGASFVLAHEPGVANHVNGEVRREAARVGHCSGTPALRMPPSRNSPCSRPLRKRRIEKPGSSARPALASARASSNLPRFANVAARKKWVSGLVRLFSMERRNNATASSSAPRFIFAAPAKCSQSQAKLSRGERRKASFSWAPVSGSSLFQVGELARTSPAMR